MVYNMTQTVLLYVAFEAGTKMQKCFFSELNCHVFFMETINIFVKSVLRHKILVYFTGNFVKFGILSNK